MIKLPVSKAVKGHDLSAGMRYREEIASQMLICDRFCADETSIPKSENWFHWVFAMEDRYIEGLT